MSFKLTKSILPEGNLLLQKARLVVVIIVRRGFFKKFEGELPVRQWLFGKSYACKDCR